MQVRLARPDDAEAVRSIYNHEVLTSTATFDLVERSAEDQSAWLATRSGAFSVLVAELDGNVVGFASLSPFRERAAYRTSVENSVYVAEGHRGRGSPTDCWANSWRPPATAASTAWSHASGAATRRAWRCI